MSRDLQTTKLASCDMVTKHLSLVIQTCTGIPPILGGDILGKVSALRSNCLSVELCQ